MSKILVTGGCGFIGYNLVKRLSKDGHEIIVIDKKLNDNNINGVYYITASTVDIDFWMRRLEKQNIKIDAVFHLGEYSKVTPSFKDSDKLLESNYIGTYKVLEYCRKNNIKIIYSASSTKHSEDSGNESPYAFSKKKNVELIKNYSKWYGLKYAITYFYNNYGPKHDTCNDGWETVVSIFEKQKKSGKKLTIVSPGTQKRIFTHVDDTVDGLIKAWKRDENDEYQLVGNDEYSIIDLAKLFNHEYELVSERKGESSRIIKKNLVNYTKKVLNWKPEHKLKDWVNKL